MAFAGELDTVPDDGLTIEGSAEARADQLPETALPPSKLPKESQFRVLKSWFIADMDHSRQWRKLCREWFAFRAGDQWTEEDKQILRDSDRPVIVFNRILTILKAVAGMEINGRHECTYLPRGTEDTAVNEVLTQASKWMGDNCDGEDEESQSFDHSATCGMGWVEERMSYLDDPSGKYIEENIDPEEMYWDRRSRKKNLSDSRRRARARRMALSDAAAMFPGKTRYQLDARWAIDPAADVAQKTLEEKRLRDSESQLPDDYVYDDAAEVTIVHMQWIERETYYLMLDPITGERKDVTVAEFEALDAKFRQFRLGLHAVKMQRNVYKQAFLGNELLSLAEDAPIRGQFSWKCITGEYDKATGTWFGLVKILRDPQMWANKWLSQILHILNTTAKGGILAELDAFEDQVDAEQTYARPDAITWLKEGALSGQNPKLMAKPGAATAFDSYLGVLTFAISSFKDVSGINLELLGQQDANQPGILEAMRKQAGMTVLATMFDSLRRFRKEVGRSRLFFIQNYLSDGRLIRITAGDSKPEAVRLAKDSTAGEYDVDIADTPTSPNQKEANWAIIQPLLAIFKEQLMAQPEVLAIILEYSPLPSRIVEAIKSFIEQQKNDPETQRKAQQQEQLAIAAATAAIRKDESTAVLNQAKASTEQGNMAYQFAMAQNLIQDNNREEAINVLKVITAQLETQKAESEREIATAKAERERVGTELDIREAENTFAKEAREAENERMSRLIDTIGALGKQERDSAAAAKDRVLAVKEARTPIADPNRKPVDPNRKPAPAKA